MVIYSAVDSLNLAFLYLILSLFSFIDWISGFEIINSLFSFIFLSLFLLFILSFICSSILLFFIIFESLVIFTFILSLLFCISYYKIRTCFYLYCLSLIGCLYMFIYICLIIIFYYYLFFILCLFLFIPFFIKIPSFPWFFWLPELHCEVNISISLFLAGCLLKLGIYGILRFIYNMMFIWLNFCICLVLIVSLLGSFIVLGCIIRCIDIKKIIGYSSIIHLTFNLMVLFGLNFIALVTGMICSLSHGYCSCGLFLISGVIINKLYSRYLDCWYYMDGLVLVGLVLMVLCNLSFPGSMNFLSELLSIVCMVSMNGMVIMGFIIYSFLLVYYYMVCFSRMVCIMYGVRGSGGWSIGGMGLSGVLVVVGVGGVW